MHIHKTRDYASFKVIVSNREVDKRHVKKLAASIARKNLPFVRPLIVNDKMEIIDGQHRLAACEQIGADVWYIKVEGLTKEDIAVLNTAQKNWALIDFINFYTIEGRREFKEFSKLVNQYPGMKITALIKLCGNSRNVREGHLNIVNIDRARQVCCWIDQLRNRGHQFAFEKEFALALDSSVETEQDFDRIMNYNSELVKCHSRPEYSRMLEKFI